jgi:hypothetical protein
LLQGHVAQQAIEDKPHGQDEQYREKGANPLPGRLQDSGANALELPPIVSRPAGDGQGLEYGSTPAMCLACAN